MLWEEIERPDHKVGPHHRPIFRARHVMKSHRVPRHEVRVLDWAIRLCPRGKSVVSLALHRIHARGVQFVRAVRRDPQLVIGKRADLLHAVIRIEQRPHCVSRHDFVARAF